MSLVKFNTRPRFRTGFDDLFNDFFEGEFFPKTIASKMGTVPSANIIESKNGFKVELAAPGMSKEDFHVEIDDDLLSIRSEKKDEKEETGDRYTKREFNYSSFVRSFRLPDHVKADEISASYADGVLTLDIPKLEAEVENKTRKIAIQ
jgi:HSP20 family protein